jgi:hypothetical protein
MIEMKHCYAHLNAEAPGRGWLAGLPGCTSKNSGIIGYMLLVRSMAGLATLLLALAVLQAQTPADPHRCRDSNSTPFSDNGKWGYLTPAGILVKPQFDIATPFFDGRAQVCTKQYCWAVDEKVEGVGPIRPRGGPFADHFSEGLGAASDGSKRGFVDETGKVVVPFRYSFTHDFSDGIAGWTRDGNRDGGVLY